MLFILYLEQFFLKLSLFLKSIALILDTLDSQVLRLMLKY